MKKSQPYFLGLLLPSQYFDAGRGGGGIGELAVLAVVGAFMSDLDIFGTCLLGAGAKAELCFKLKIGKTCFKPQVEPERSRQLDWVPIHYYYM